MRDYLELSKPRITTLVVLTTWMAYRLAGGEAGARLLWTLLGTLLAACSTGILNQYLESDVDGKMARTRNRPLPQGRLAPRQALVFGVACAVSGLAILIWKVNGLACALAALTIASYILLYTPMKRRTPHSTWVGALAGAMPPLIGWAAGSGTLSAMAWSLFGIQFLWQIPHFLAIFWMHREDYARAGFQVMPVVDPGGGSTACQIAIHSLALLLASLLPLLLGWAGVGYGYAALAMGTVFLMFGLRASWTMSVIDARRLFFASLIYLPALFGILAFGSA